MLAKPKTGALRDGFPGFSGFLLFLGTPLFLFLRTISARRAALFRPLTRARGQLKLFRRVQTPQLGYLRRLDPLEYFLSAARASRRSEQCRAARAVAWPNCQNFPKPENPGFPVFPKISQSPPPAVHPLPISRKCCLLARARKMKVIGRRRL